MVKRPADVTRLSANLGWLFTDRPFLERFAAAAAAGFKAVEIPTPYDFTSGQIAAAMREHALELVQIAAPFGNLSAGECGYAAQPGREEEFWKSLETALAYARACGAPCVHTLSGPSRPGIPLALHEDLLVANLQRAAPLCADAGVTLLIEPINARDLPGYVLTSTSQAIAILDRVAHPSVSLQLDLYNVQITEGDPVPRIRALRGRFRHVQIAGVPERREPDDGDFNIGRAFDALQETGYDGWVGCEYRPRAGTEAGLAWAETYLRPASTV
jgi:hydroxypyruvate isomerase